MRTYAEILKARTFAKALPEDPKPARAETATDSRCQTSQVRLLALLGRKVRTPVGVGVLWQVFEEQTGVLLDRDAQELVTYFPTRQIEPVIPEP